MTRRRVVVAGVVLAALLVLEAVAVPVARRILADVASRCVAYETLELIDVDRPVLPRLLLGRAREVEVRATGVEVGPLRIAQAHLAMAEATLPWALGDRGPQTATLSLRLAERDLERALRAVLPLDLPIDLQLEPGVAVVGAPPLPVTLDLEVEVEEDGTVVLLPRTGAELLDRFDVRPRFPPAPEARVLDLTIGEGQLTGAVALEMVPEVGGGAPCEEPLASR